MLKPQDLEPQNKLPSKDERKAMKAQQEKDAADVQILKNLCLEFLNDKLLSLDIPVFLVEEMVPQVLTAQIKIHKAKSVKYAQYIKAKSAWEEESIKDIKYVEKLEE